MRRFDGQPLLSPSDLNNLLECRHLMALELARFSGNGVATVGPRRARRHPRPLRRAARGRDPGGVRSEWANRRARVGAGARMSSAPRIEQTLEAMRARRRRDPPGDARGRRVRWICRLPGARRAALRPGRLELRGGRREAGARDEGLLPGAAVGLRRAAREPPGARARELGCCSATAAGTPTAPTTSPPTCGGPGVRGARPSRPGSARPIPCPAATARICVYRQHCDQRRRADDHLSLVAGIRRDQVARLELDGIATLAALAGLDPERPVQQFPSDSLAKLRRQAALQLPERETGEQCYELLDYGPGHGFGLLPEPAPGDLFFDIEGDPYIGDRGLVYLFGSAGWRCRGALRGVLGAHREAGEGGVRACWSTSSWAGAQRHPGCHIYHYGADRGDGAEGSSRCTTPPASPRWTRCFAPAPWSTSTASSGRACASPRRATR